MVPGAPRPLQVPAPCRLRRNPEDVDRQGAKIRPARASEAHRRQPSLTAMRADAWPQYCRAALVRSVRAAAAQFPAPGEEAPERVHDMRKTLKEARAIARLFLHCVGEPARVTMAALAATRRQTGRARDLDVMAVRLSRLAPPPEVAGPMNAAIAREREAALRARRGAAARAPRARLNAIAKRLARWDLSALGGDAIVAGVARTYRQARRRGRRRLRERRSGGAACIPRPGRRSALPARASRLRLAGSAERPGRSAGRASPGARRPSRSPCAGGVRRRARRPRAGGARRPDRAHGGEAEEAPPARRGRVRSPVRRNRQSLREPASRPISRGR